MNRLGQLGSLSFLAFDHRGPLQRLLGIGDDPSPADADRIVDAKRLVFEGVLTALERGADPQATGVIIDEEFGADLGHRAKAAGLTLAMPVNQSERPEWDFHYGAEWREHILAFDPDFAKVLVRHNPDGDPERNGRQLARLTKLSDWLHANARRLLFELIVPPEPAQLAEVHGDIGRYDAELRPALTVQAMEEIQARGIEPDVWKLEGPDTQDDAERLAAQARAGAARSDVACVLLGRGADDATVTRWLKCAAPVAGFIGFAIGRTIWSDAVAEHARGELARGDAAARIADRHLRLVAIFDGARGRSRTVEALAPSR